MNRIQFNLVDQFQQADFNADSLFIKIGCGSSFAESKPNTLYRIKSEQEAKKLFGFSSLTDSLCVHFRQKGKEIYAIRPHNSLPSRLINIKKIRVDSVGRRSDALDLEITRRSKFEDVTLYIKIVKGGLPKDSQLAYSFDGINYGPSINLSEEITINNIFIKLIYTPRTQVTPGDIFLIEGKGERYQKENLSPTFDVIKKDRSLSFSIIHFVDFLDDYNKDKSLQLIGEVNRYIDDLRSHKLWFRALIQCRDRSIRETESIYRDYLDSIFNEIYSENLILCFQYVHSLSLDKLRPAADYLLATLSRAKVQESPGWIYQFKQKDIKFIKETAVYSPSVLEEKGITYLYFEEGFSHHKTPYFNIGRLKTPVNSDFRTISSGRVMDKSLALVNQVIQPVIGANVEVYQNPRSGFLSLKTRIESVLEEMLQTKEILSYEIIFPEQSKSDLLDIHFKIESNRHIEKMDFYVSFKS